MALVDNLDLAAPFALDPHKTHDGKALNGSSNASAGVGSGSLPYLRQCRRDGVIPLLRGARVLERAPRRHHSGISGASPNRPVGFRALTIREPVIAAAGFRFVTASSAAVVAAASMVFFGVTILIGIATGCFLFRARFGRWT